MIALIKIAHKHNNTNCKRRWLVAAIFYSTKKRQKTQKTKKRSKGKQWKIQTMFRKLMNKLCRYTYKFFFACLIFTLSMTAISVLKRFMILPNGVTWKKYNDLFTIEFSSNSCNFRLARQPANWPAGVDTIENTIQTIDNKP